MVVSTIGPGSLGGDVLRIDGSVGAEAHLIVESQSATKIYGPGISRYEARWRVAEGGTLELRNEPLLLFGGAAYVSHTEVLLARGARLCMRECVSRAEDASASARITTIVRRDGRLALRDAMQLGDETLGTRSIGTLVGFGGALRDRPVCSDVRAGVGTTLLDGTFLRVSGRRAWDVRATLESAYSL
ncbi:MAG TPA: urease accessory protein UreD [Candidatus Acidoferrales bacterium]|nr:urease accessory protein UreD [Candidatus Acidoferrales bacterium]